MNKEIIKKGLETLAGLPRRRINKYLNEFAFFEDICKEKKVNTNYSILELWHTYHLTEEINKAIEAIGRKEK